MSELLTLLHWKDCVEVLIIFVVIYRIVRWLAKSQNELLLLCYGYSGLLILSFLSDLYALQTLLLIMFPVVAVVAVLFHQDLLQRNFVAARSVSNTGVVAENWLEAVMRAMIQSPLDARKRYVCIIENDDSLDQILTTSIVLNTPCHYEVVRAMLFLQKEPHQLLWIKSSGMLVAADAVYKIFCESASPEESIGKEEDEEWKQQALILTQKTDALVFCLSRKSGTAVVVYEGKAIEDVSIAIAVRLIKQKIKNVKKKEPYEPRDKKMGIQQNYL